MDAGAIIDRLEAFAAALPAVVGPVRPDDARWKPPSGAWSILEIVCHLVDEETRDFRARLTRTLREPARAWPPIDPEGWARDEAYNSRDPGEMTAAFLHERRESVRQLRELAAGAADWTFAHQHPRFGPIRAGDLLASWAAHDALHLRQIAKRLHELASRDAPEFSTRYAGEWGA